MDSRDTKKNYLKNRRKENIFLKQEITLGLNFLNIETIKL